MPTPWSAETSLARFETDVIEGSKRLPILLDFTASWCGPCQILGPLLERLAEEMAGKFQLLKIDLDENMPLAQELGVSSVPTVFAFRDGRIVGRFLGALPEPEVRAFLAKVLPTPAQERLARAEELLHDDPQRALALLEEDHRTQPEDEELQAVRAQALFRLGNSAEARAAASLVTEASTRYESVRGVLSRLEFQEKAEPWGGVAACREAAWKDPKDAQAHLRLGIALAAAGEYADALGALLTAGELDPKLVHGEAKEAMLAIFQILGPDSDLAGDYRAKLAALLY